MLVFTDDGDSVVYLVPQSPSSSSGALGLCRALYDYGATAPNQLSLREGDIITIVSKAGERSGWWKGSKDGKVSFRFRKCRLTQPG